LASTNKKPTLPFIVGAEASGEIVEIGKDVSDFKVGDCVVIGMRSGVCCEEIVIPAQLCFPKPKSFSHEEAAGLLVGFCTAYHGLVQRGNLQKDEFLLITGAAGGMGLSAIQVGKLIGAKIIAAVSSEQKMKEVLAMGADFAINYSTQDMKEEVNRITKGKYVHVIYETRWWESFRSMCSSKLKEKKTFSKSFFLKKPPSVLAMKEDF
jgi:NADPH:quinone reductase